MENKNSEGWFRTTDPIYFPRPIPMHSRGIPRLNVLPNGEGFSYNMSPPSCDFKVFRAMCNAGFKPEAEKIIFKKRRSYITPDIIFKGLVKYTEKSVPELDDPVYHQVVREARAQFVTKLTPITFKEAAKTLPQSMSPGLPYLHSHPGKNKGEILETNLPKIINYWEDVGAGRPTLSPPDCAAFNRSHMDSADTNKVRPVWAFPLDVVVTEARFAQPIIKALKDRKIGRNTAYGMGMVNGGMIWLNYQISVARDRDPGCKFLMTDYLSFDSSVPAWLIYDCFSIIWECYDGNVTPADFKIFTKLVHYFINTTIRNPDGRRLRKFHGIPSGSMFTNIIGTMANFIISRYIIKRMCCADPMFDLYFGDDAVIFLRSATLINIQSLSEAASYYFGTLIHTKKSYWTNNISNVHFLGYYNYHGCAYKPTNILMASLLFPQYWIDDWKYILVQTMERLMAAGDNNKGIFLKCQMIYNLALNTVKTTFEKSHL